VPDRPRFEIRRVYDDEGPSDGYRVLVDRLWPRGISKERAALDEWPKDVAPSDALRRWYGHDPAKFDEFSRRYRSELSAPPAKDVVDALRRKAEDAPVILVTATRDVEHSGAAVLLEALTQRPTDSTG
jgi:uncharacterized protein YeaO (DUF488 family)